MRRKYPTLLNGGSFLVRTANGLSRPVSVYVDASARLLTAPLPGVVRAEVKAQDDGSYVCVSMCRMMLAIISSRTLPPAVVKHEESYHGQTERAQLTVMAVSGPSSVATAIADNITSHGGGVHEFTISVWRQRHDTGNSRRRPHRTITPSPSVPLWNERMERRWAFVLHRRGLGADGRAGRQPDSNRVHGDTPAPLSWAGMTSRRPATVT